MIFKNLLIIQARMDSTRLPGKVMMNIGKYKIIEFLIKRISKSKKINKILVATSKNMKDDALCEFLSQKKINFYRGEEFNVLKRFYNASIKYNPKYIIRITADCPLIDSKMIDKMIKIFESNSFDYISNTNPPTFPDGLDIEIFTFMSLKDAYKNAKTKYEKEHVTPYIKLKKKNKKFNYENKVDLSENRWTIDQKEDYDLIKKIFKKLNNKVFFDWEMVLRLKEKHPNIFKSNIKIKRNEGAKMNTSQKLWTRALKVIPNGNMFLSKNPNQFLPDIWPAYFSKAKDSYVWDLDKKKYFDFCTMGVGTNILGYSNKIIDKAVKSNISNGTMSSLNCPEEVFLSERLLSIHKEFNMVKLARTGGEANSIAIRIARANTNKQKVLICGYHGWHDWYLAQDKNSINGKIIKININTDEYEIVSMGHRNPQGLYFDRDNNFILETEHGPQGGDEINLIEIKDLDSNEIPNYGWAISSYGEHYGGKKESNISKYEKYPLYKSHKEYGFIEPVHAFVPSIGISQIEKIEKNQYVTSSLKDGSLYFFELNSDNQLNNLKRVEVFERTRDIVFKDNKLFLFLEDSASLGIININ